MSSLINKAKAALSKDKTDDPRSDNYGPHSSNMANTADPRVDSDLDHRNNPSTGYGHSNPGGAYAGTSTTTTGPHSSNLANRADPRVDSDFDRGQHGAHTSHAAGGYGSTGAGAGAGYGDTTGAGYGTHGSANAGPHSSNLANKLDPRVDSDFDGRNNPSSTYGNPTSGGAYTDTTYSGSTNAGPHSSNFANKVDPRVDSDRDNRNDPTSRVGGYGHQEGYGIQGSNPAPSSGGYAPTHHQSTAGGYGAGPTGGAGYDDSASYGTHGTAGTSGIGHTGAPGSHGTHGSSGYAAGAGAGSGAGYGSSYTPGSGDANKTAGPHDSNLLNKLDPRVDSDLDGSKTYGGNQTHR